MLMFIVTYMQALLDGLKTLDWPDKVKNIQAEWIGRSEGAYFDFPLTVSQPFQIPNIHFSIQNGDSIRVFTTASYSLYGVTFLAISTQHPITKVCDVQWRGTKYESALNLFVALW